GEQIEALLGPDGLPGGKNTGIFLHELVENTDLNTVNEIKSIKAWLVDEQIEKTIMRSMKTHAIDPEYLEFCKNLLWHALKTPLICPNSPKNGSKPATLGCVADFERTLRELEFLYPFTTKKPASTALPGVLNFEDGFIKGFVDLIFERNGKFYW